MSDINEEVVRRIIREELKSLLDSLTENASNSIGYASELESAAIRSIEDVMRSEAYYMPHDWKCGLRIGRWPHNKCTCGIDEGKKSNE